MRRFLVRKAVVYTVFEVLDSADDSPVDEELANERVSEGDGAVGVALDLAELTPEEAENYRADGRGMSERLNALVGDQGAWRRLVETAFKNGG